MYLHAGNNRNIRARDVIGIFDADTATVSAATKQFLAARKAEKAVEFAAIELPKSFVLYRANQKNARRGFSVSRARTRARGADRPAYRICFSQLSSASLAGRIENK